MSRPEQELYGRQMRLPGHGEAGQARLAAARVLLVGAGGLGSPAALYLAAAGVGTIGIADPDTVELSNLHRQILHGPDSLGLPKTVSAAEALAVIRPDLRLALHPEGLRPDNALELTARYDLVVDGADNFPTRYLAADACVLSRRPLVHGSVQRWSGQVGAFLPGEGCYRCLYPVMPDPSTVPTCAEAGVLGATCGVVGSWMASEAVAILLGRRKASRLMLVDVEAGSARPIALKPDAACPVCGEHPRIRQVDPSLYPSVCAMSDPQPTPCPIEISVDEARRLLAEPQPPFLLDVREADELAICRLPGSVHIPLGELPLRHAEVPRDRRVVIHCHHGGRSLRATQFLRSKGHAEVSNLKGGIDAWSIQVDPAVPRY